MSPDQRINKKGKKRSRKTKRGSIPREEGARKAGNFEKNLTVLANRKQIVFRHDRARLHKSNAEEEKDGRREI